MYIFITIKIHFTQKMYSETFVIDSRLWPYNISEKYPHLLFQILPNLRLGFNMREKEGTWLQAELRL